MMWWAGWNISMFDFAAFVDAQRNKTQFSVSELAYLYYLKHKTYDGFFDWYIREVAIDILNDGNIASDMINYIIDSVDPNIRLEAITNYLEKYKAEALRDSMRMAISKVIQYRFAVREPLEHGVLIFKGANYGQIK